MHSLAAYRTNVPELQSWDWTDSDEILTDDDIVLLTMPLDEMAKRRNARVLSFVAREQREQDDALILAEAV